jgi:hypothetical protein
MPSRIDIGPDGGPYVAINENNNDLELQDINGNVIAKWDETAGQWDFNANDLANAGTVSADDIESEERPLVNIRAYGAVGDGVTDDASAIQAAADKAESIGGRVYIPPTSDYYAISQTIVSGENCGLVGEGRKSQIGPTSGFSGSELWHFDLSGASSPTSFSLANYVARDVLFRGSDTLGTTGSMSGIKLTDMRQMEIENLLLADLTDPIDFNGVAYVETGVVHLYQCAGDLVVSGFFNESNWGTLRITQHDGAISLPSGDGHVYNSIGGGELERLGTVNFRSSNGVIERIRLEDLDDSVGPNMIISGNGNDIKNIQLSGREGSDPVPIQVSGSRNEITPIRASNYNSFVYLTNDSAENTINLRRDQFDAWDGADRPHDEYVEDVGDNNTVTAGPTEIQDALYVTTRGEVTNLVPYAQNADIDANWNGINGSTQTVANDGPFGGDITRCDDSGSGDFIIRAPTLDISSQPSLLNVGILWRLPSAADITNMDCRFIVNGSSTEARAFGKNQISQIGEWYHTSIPFADEAWSSTDIILQLSMRGNTGGAGDSFDLAQVTVSETWHPVAHVNTGANAATEQGQVTNY